MTSPSIFDPIAGRVEQLVQKYEAVQQANHLLTQEIQVLQKERDSLRSRLKAARARVDELIERLPANQESL